MGFSVSMTREGVTYSIEGEDFGSFLNFYSQVHGLHGFLEAIAEQDQLSAELAVAPIAAADQAAPVTTPGVTDKLADLIRAAPDLQTLGELWRTHKDAWNGDYNRLAGERRKQLEKAAK